MSFPIEHIAGDDRGSLKLYALSTCMWCRKTKELLEHIGAAYDVVEVDTLAPAEKEEAMAEIERWNPQRTFPTLVVNDEKCIVGYQKDKIREALGLWP